MNRLLSFAVACGVLSSSLSAMAAPISGYRADGEDHVHANVGWNSAPDVELSYGRRVQNGVVPRLDAELALAIPIFLAPKFDSYRLEPSVRASLLQEGNWGLAARFGLPIQTGANQTFRFASLGAHTALTGGYFARGGFVALEADWTALLTTYISPTDRARETYGGIRSGFYAPMGGYIDLALAGGITIGEHAEIGLRAGYRRTQRFNAPPVVPFVGELGFSYAF